MVVAFHRRWWVGGHFQHAYLAVDFFFLLSGFVVAHAYGRKLLGTMSFWQFVKVRALRLYPLLIVGACLGVAAFSLDHSPERAWQLLPFAAAAVPAPSALSDIPFPLNGPGWSLFYELSINLAFAAAIPWLSNRLLAAVVIASAVAECWMIFHFGGLRTGFEYDTLLVGFIRVLFPFGLGVLVYRYREQIPRLDAPFWTLAAALLVIFLAPRDVYGSLEVFDLAIVAVAFPLILMSASQREPSTRHEVALAKWSGFISYPVYIMHYPLLSIFERAVADSALPAVLYFPLALVSIVPACHVAGVADERFRRAATSFRQRLRAEP